MSGTNFGIWALSYTNLSLRPRSARCTISSRPLYNNVVLPAISGPQRVFRPEMEENQLDSWVFVYLPHKCHCHRLETSGVKVSIPTTIRDREIEKDVPIVRQHLHEKDERWLQGYRRPAQLGNKPTLRERVIYVDVRNCPKPFPVEHVVTP